MVHKKGFIKGTSFPKQILLPYPTNNTGERCVVGFNIETLSVTPNGQDKITETLILPFLSMIWLPSVYNCIQHDLTSLFPCQTKSKDFGQTLLTCLAKIGNCILFKNTEPLICAASDLGAFVKIDGIMNILKYQEILT